MEYPTRNGLPIDPLELGYGSLGGELINNHHNGWRKRDMGKLALTQTFRDLDATQFQIPVSQHQEIHKLYEPPRLLLPQVYDRVSQAFEEGELLRFGTANNFWQRKIHKPTMDKITREYRDIQRRILV